MIEISENAQEEIHKALTIKGIPAGYFLRVGIKGGACSANYLLGFDKKEENDEIHNIHGIDVLINKGHLMYLIGLTIDFEEEGNGFTFVK